MLEDVMNNHLSECASSVFAIGRVLLSPVPYLPAARRISVEHLNSNGWTKEMPCNGICQRSVNIIGITTRYGQGRYDQGQKWCSKCELFISHFPEPSNFCSCCKSKLRSRPRSMKFKNKFRNRMSNSYSLSTIITSGK